MHKVTSLIGPNLISNIFLYENTEKVTYPSYGVIEGLHKVYPDINMQWFLFGKGEMFDDKQSEIERLQVENKRLSEIIKQIKAQVDTFNTP